MNFWIEKLPDSVEIDGKEYPIQTDFRVWVKCSILLEQEKNPILLTADLLALCYQTLPPSFEGAMKGIFSFYIGEKDTKRVGEKTKPIYSFLHDADLIYAAFYSQYGIDLATASLHWYQFRALFSGLDENNRFSEVLCAREVNLSKVSDPAQKSYYKKLKGLYGLPSETDAAQALEALF